MTPLYYGIPLCASTVLWPTDRKREKRDWREMRICLVCLVYLVRLIWKAGKFWSLSFVLLSGPATHQRNQRDQIDRIDQRNKTARSCVGYRSCHPNRVMSGNPSVALADCPAPHSSYWLASNGRAYWHRASIARPLNHHPATEAGAVPFARWLHKSGSNSNEAANLLKRSTSLSC
jgi:hypothetical protein